MALWYCGVMVITDAHFHSSKAELSFCTASNSTYSMLEFTMVRTFNKGPCDGNKAFFQSTIPQKQSIMMHH